MEGDPFFNIAAGQTMTQSGLISDGGSAGTIEVTGGGTLKLTNAANSYSGGTVVSDGSTLSISSDGNLGNGGTVSLEDGTTLAFTAGGTYTHSVKVSGDPTFDVATGQTVTQVGLIADGGTPGELEVTGGGTLVLGNASNSYSGGTTVIAGSTVSIAADGDLGAAAGGLTLGDASTGGTLATTATLSSARGVTLGAGGGSVDVADGKTTTFSGAVSGDGGLTKTDTGTLTLGGSNDYTGDTNVTGGTLSISADANLGNGGTVKLAEGTTLSFLAGGTYTHDVTVTGDPIFDTNGNTVTENGQITDGGSPPAGEVVVTGGGTLVLGNASNSYSGGTRVIEGSTVSVAADGDLGAASGGVILGDATTGGTLATTVGFDSARTVTLENGGGTVDTAGGVTTGLSGQVTGAGKLTKDGTGTLILSGVNNYGGGTTVSGGSLQGDTGSLQGDITDNANVTFDQSTAGSYGGVLSGNGTLTKSGSGVLTLSGSNSYQRRHERDRRRARHLLRRQSRHWRDGEPGRGHHPLLPRRRHLHPRRHRDGRSDLRHQRQHGDRERPDHRWQQPAAGRGGGDRRRHAGAGQCEPTAIPAALR